MPILPNFIRLALAGMVPLTAFGPNAYSEEPESSPVAVREWAHEESDLNADSAVVWGKLDNGLRYAILPNSEPPRRVAVRLYVDAGSLMEEDDQQGLAHFLEHMAFNGTKNFPAGEMIEYFQRLGMAFGADTNAHTSFKETVYKLELPNAEPELLDKAFQLLADYAGAMLLAEEEIEKERGVILSEKLSRDSVQFRTMQEGFKFAMPEAKLSRRMPIGTEEVIKGAPRERFVEFYQKWYTMDRMVLVLVGDVKAEEIEPKIIEHFKGLAGPEKVVPDPDLGRITAGRGVVAKLHTEKEMPYVEISIETARPSKKLPDSAAKRLADLRHLIANQMLKRRFDVLAKEDGAPFLNASAYHYDYLQFVELSGIEITCKPETWEGAVSMAEKELRRALQFGFTRGEFEEAKANVLNMFQEQAKQAGTRNSRDLADSMVSAVGNERVFTHPGDDLVRVEKNLSELTPENCLEALREAWEKQDVLIFVGGNVEVKDADPSEKILEVYRKSGGEKVEPPVEKEQVPFAYTEFGEAGKVASKVVVDDLGLTQVVFENNVRLNVKPTEFEDNVIRVMVRFGGGKLEAPADKPGLVAFAASVFDEGGLEAHSADELDRLFAGKTVGASFSVGDDAFVLGGRTNGDDLVAQMQLLAAFLTAPGYREEGQRQFRKGIDGIYQKLAHTLEGTMQNEVSRFVRGGDFRFGFPAQAELEERNLDEVRAWLAEPLSKSYLEISLVGDVNVEQAVEAVAATFGALPERAAAKPEFKEERAMAFPREPAATEFTYKSEIPRAAVAVYWPTDDMWDIARTRRLVSLSQIFDDRLRLKVREEMGESYSPASYHSASDTFSGYGYLVAIAQCKPDQAEVIGGLARQIAEELKTGEISDDEFERAMKPQMTQLEQLRRDNLYWMNSVVSSSQEHPVRLDWARSIEEDFKVIKKEDLTKLAKDFLGAEKGIQVVVKPVE